MNSRWATFIMRRLLGLLLVVLGLVIATFLMVRVLPGDVAITILGSDASEANRQLVRTQLGLDRPLLEQFGQYATDLARGDLGVSFVTRQPVRNVIGERLPRSAVFAVCSLILVLLVSVPFG